MEGNIVISKLDDEFLWSIIVINSTLIFISEWKEVYKISLHQTDFACITRTNIWRSMYVQLVYPVCWRGADSVWAHPAPPLPTIFPCGYVRSGNVETDHCVNWSSLGTGHSTSHHTPVSAKILCM